MLVNDTTKRKHVNVEKGWTKNKALVDPTSNSVEGVSELISKSLVSFRRAVLVVWEVPKPG